MAVLKAYTLATAEIDDREAALAEIGGQLAALSLQAASVGIIVCHNDYVHNGTVEALAAMLPFPLVGATTFYQMAPEVDGLFELTVTVLTGDGLCFGVACSREMPQEQSPGGIVCDTYNKAAGALAAGCAPALIFSFLSLQRPISGDEYLRLIDGCSGGVPHFGAVAIGDDDTGRDVYVISGGKVYPQDFAILLVGGDVQARFQCGNYKLEQLLEMTATVTGAEGTSVTHLNGQPAVDFVRKNGFVLEEDDRNAVSNIPFLFKPAVGGVPLARTLCGFDPATGALHFLGEIPVGVLLRISTVTIEDILEVSCGTVRCALDAHPNAAAAFIFSCVGRYVTLGLDSTLEMQQATGLLPAGMPYLACYVGGEICPAGESPEQLKNQYHNASFVVCTLS